MFRPVTHAAGLAAAVVVRYEPWRVAAGLVVATILLAIAVVVIRHTDWRPPSQADTPGFDGPWRFDD